MNCRICGSRKLELVIDFGNQPWANNFLHKSEVGREEFYPLRLMFCSDCRTSQLDHTVKKEVMFSNHTYLSGITSTLSHHFKQIALYVDKTFFHNLKNKSVLDIGSNDGTQLKHYVDLGYDVLGVESSTLTAKIANDAGIKTLNKFFNLSLATEINKKFSVINASGVFFHLEELHSVCEGIKQLLDDKGVFVVQFIYMKAVLDNLAFDQIYHEHLLFYTLTTISILLAKYNLEIFDANLVEIHGGSIIAFVSHVNKYKKTDRFKNLYKDEQISNCNDISSYVKFANSVKKLKKLNINYLYKNKLSGKRIYGFGAPVKGNTLLNYFDIGIETIQVLVEKNELRKNLYSPGKHIPIVLENEIYDQPDIYYVLAWNFKKEILANNKKLLDSGVEFYFPINPREY